VNTGRRTGGNDAWPATITVIDGAAIRPAVCWDGSLECHDSVSYVSLTSQPLRPGEGFSTWPLPFWGSRPWRPDSIKRVYGDAGAIQPLSYGRLWEAVEILIQGYANAAMFNLEISTRAS
jgi:hypothetical protein